MQIQSPSLEHEPRALESRSEMQGAEPQRRAVSSQGPSNPEFHSRPPCIFDLDRSARDLCSNVGKRIQLIVSSPPEKDTIEKAYPRPKKGGRIRWWSV